MPFYLIIPISYMDKDQFISSVPIGQKSLLGGDTTSIL